MGHWKRRKKWNLGDGKREKGIWGENRENKRFWGIWRRNLSEKWDFVVRKYQNLHKNSQIM